MGARYYSPQFSIFTSVDPMHAYRSWISPYNYVQNNPVMRQDPTGMLDIGPDDGPGDPKKGGETASGSKNKILQGGLLAEGTVVEKAPNKITSLLVRNAVNAGRFFKRSAEATKDWLSNVTTADVFNTTLDFIPIAGGLKDIWQGISDGNGWIIALGVGTVALDIFTFGSASLLKGSVKLGIRGVRKAAQKKAVRETSETLAEQGVKKAAKSGSVGKKIHDGGQGKHIPGHNNYVPAKKRSILKSDAQGLLDDFHSGNIKSSQTINDVKTRVDFGKEIGTYINKETGVSVPTTNGIIHTGKNGAHIVPSAPN